jgi:hypothetical protein
LYPRLHGREDQGGVAIKLYTVTSIQVNIVTRHSLREGKNMTPLWSLQTHQQHHRRVELTNLSELIMIISIYFSLLLIQFNFAPNKVS